jgi:hypothetical protein
MNEVGIRQIAAPGVPACGEHGRSRQAFLIQTRLSWKLPPPAGAD